MVTYSMFSFAVSMFGLWKMCFNYSIRFCSSVSRQWN